VERSDAVSDSDADRRQMLSRPPTLSGPYYEPDTVEGGGFENAFFAANPIGGAYSDVPAMPLLALLASRRDGTGSRFLTLDPTRPASFSPGDPTQSLSELKQILDSEHVSK